MQTPRHGWNALILLFIITLIFTPRVITGWLNLQSAHHFDSSNDPVSAAIEYASAAQRLFWRTDLWELAGLSALEGDRPDMTILYLETAKDCRSLSVNGWLALGDAYDGIGDKRAAISAWQEAGRMAPAYMRMAEERRAMGDLTGAIQDWRDLLTLEPKNSTAHYQLGLLLVATDPENALSELMQASNDPLLDASVQALRTSLNAALLSDSEPYRQVVIGRALATQEEWDLAEIALRRAVLLRADYAPGWAWIGEAEQQLGRDGLPYLEKAIHLEPQSAMSYILYGLYWQRQGQTPKAVEAYKKAVELEPETAAWHIALGSAYEQYGDLPMSEMEYVRAIELDPEEASGWRALALFCAVNGYDLSGIGLPAAQNLVQLAPDDWRSLDVAGQVSLAFGDLKEAQRLFEKAIRLAPTKPEPHLHLALILLELGNLTMAHQELTTTYDLDPDGAVGWQTGRLLEQYFP